MNLSELQYLADHLSPEECRRLFASIHFKSYEEPNALDQAGKITSLKVRVNICTLVYFLTTRKESTK